MKKFAVSKACNACGECMVRTDLLIEDENGFAVPVVGKFIQECDLPEAEKTATLCPMQALSIEESGLSGDVRALSKVLFHRLSSVEIPDIKPEEISYNEEDYTLNFGRDQDEDHADFSFRHSAKSAGESRFYEIFWNHRQDYALSVLAQYKSTKLRPFYDFKNRKKTYYAKIGQQMETILGEIKAEAEALTGGAISLSDEFTVFAPESDRYFRKMAAEKMGEIDSVSYVQDFLERMEKKEKRQRYEDRVYAQEHVEIIGKDWLGNNKIKTTYRYKNVNAVGAELAKDIRFGLRVSSTMGLRSVDDISEDNIKFILSEYRELVKKEIQKKVHELETAVDKL